MPLRLIKQVSAEIVSAEIALLEDYDNRYEAGEISIEEVGENCHKARRKFQRFLDIYVNNFIRKIYAQGFANLDADADKEIIGKIYFGMRLVEKLISKYDIAHRGNIESFNNYYTAIKEIVDVIDLLYKCKNTTLDKNTLSQLLTIINKKIPYPVDEDNGQFVHLLFCQRISDYLKQRIEKSQDEIKLSLTAQEDADLTEAADQAELQSAQIQTEREIEIPVEATKKDISKLRDIVANLYNDASELLQCFLSIEKHYDQFLSVIEVVLAEEIKDANEHLQRLYCVMQLCDFSELSTLLSTISKFLESIRGVDVSEFLNKVEDLNADLQVLGTANKLMEKIMLEDFATAEEILNELQDGEDTLGKVVNICQEIFDARPRLQMTA